MRSAAWMALVIHLRPLQGSVGLTLCAPRPQLQSTPFAQAAWRGPKPRPGSRVLLPGGHARGLAVTSQELPKADTGPECLAMLSQPLTAQLHTEVCPLDRTGPFSLFPGPRWLQCPRKRCVSRHSIAKQVCPLQRPCEDPQFLTAGTALRPPC